MTRINHGNQTEIRAIIADIKAMCHLMGKPESSYLRFKKSYIKDLKTYGVNDKMMTWFKELRRMAAKHTADNLNACIKLGLM